MAIKTVKDIKTTPSPNSQAESFDALAAGYTAKNIRTVEDLDAVRNRPTQFFPDTEIMGLRHAAKEITDNGLDEINLLGDRARMSATIVRDLSAMTYVMIIEDTGRGIPLECNSTGTPTFVAAATKLNTSGKYDQNAYATSSGSFGLGMKGSAGTSCDFRVITKRLNGTGSLHVHKGQYDKGVSIDNTPNQETGTLVVYRPDPEIFTGIDAFTESGYGLIIDLFRQYVFFRHYNLEFRVLDGVFPEEFWKAKTSKALKIIADIQSRASVAFDSNVNDPDEWIRGQWGLSRHFTWRTSFQKPKGEAKSLLEDYIVKLYYVKGDRQGGTFGLVNNVPISGLNNDHLSVTYGVIQEAIGKRITDPAIRRFYQEGYKLPLFLAVDVKFSGAMFGGTTKDTFRNPVFRKLYEHDLSHWVGTASAKEELDAFYGLIEEDIKTRYEESLNIKVVQKDRGRLASRLKRPTKYDDIGELTRDAELFLVEGDSAAPKRGVNQAIYKMGGKPLNLVKVSNGKSKSQLIEMTMKVDIYHDIFTLIGYDPRKPNLDTLNFKNGFVLSDADNEFMSPYAVTCR